MRRMFWTKREEEILKTLYPNIDISQREIISIFKGRTWASISSHAQKVLRISRQKKGSIDEEAYQKLKRTYGV